MKTISLACLLFALAGGMPGCAHKQPAAGAVGPQKRIVGFQSPEDLIALDGTPYVFVSNQKMPTGPGWISVVDSRSPDAAPVRLVPGGPVADAPTTPDCPGPPDFAQFAPHGIALAKDTDLLVVNHGGRESIEVFTIGEGPTLGWRDCIILPKDLEANGVSVLTHGRIAATGMVDPTDKQAGDKAVKGEVSGRVIVWQGEWHDFTPQGFAFANGIASSKTHVFVTEWTRRKLWRFDMDGSNGRAIDLDFLADNIRWSPAGKLLVTGQRVDVGELIACDEQAIKCPRGFAVVEVDPGTLAVTPLIVSDGTPEFGGATSAIVVGDELWVGNILVPELGRFPLQHRE